MESITIYKLLYPQRHWLLQVSALVFLVLHIPSTMVQQLSSQLFQIYAWDRRVFVNYVEVLDTRLMPASSVALNSSCQVLEEKWISLTPLVYKNQMKHQESGINKLQNIISNPRPLLSIPALWFHLSGGYLIIMLLIMVMSSFTLQIIHWNQPMTLLQIQILLQPIQLMMIKRYSSLDYFTHNMTMIFWILISGLFKIY